MHINNEYSIKVRKKIHSQGYITFCSILQLNMFHRIASSLGSVKYRLNRLVDIIKSQNYLYTYIVYVYNLNKYLQIFS